LTDRPPAGAWDCHAHVLGDRAEYPLAPGRGYDPPVAPLNAYLELLDDLGLARGVLVQPSVYGFDNRCMLDALDRAEGRLVGVAVPSPDTTPRDLEAMHRRGVRAVRCNQINPGGLDPETVVSWAPVLLELGWHVEIHLDLEPIADLGAFARSFGVPVVFDHMGRPTPDRLDPNGPVLSHLVRLAREQACVVKLSAPYRLTASPAPWSAVDTLARTLLDAAPASCVWATDWPHVDTAQPVRPEELAATLDAWCPQPDVCRTVLVETSSRLYGGG